MKELMWAGGVRKKKEGDGTGLVEKFDVHTGSTALAPQATPRMARRGVLESGTLVDTEQLDNQPKSRSHPSGRFNLVRDD